MRFKPTRYKLLNVASKRLFEDRGWTLADPEAECPSLVRAVYENKDFTPRDDLKGLYRYAEWLPVQRTLRHSCAPVTYLSKGLGSYFGMDKLFITFSGYNPRIGARFKTCSFKETEAFSVCARMSRKEARTLVVQSAGNTARAFAQVCSDNQIPVVICIPEDNKHDLWFQERLHPCVKVVAAPAGCDYFDAITLGNKICQDPAFFLEGGATNIARRDGMGTTLLSAVEVTGRVPDAYFQAVGSGTGAIAVHENNLRLLEDGRFGSHLMRIYVAQNRPFTLLYDSWKAGSRALAELDPDKGRHQAECILAKVLSNRKPPYSIAGGLFDTLKDSGGDAFLASNDDIIYWILQFRNLEGYDIFPAAACAVHALSCALTEGKVRRDEMVMLNVTGGGSLAAMSKGYFVKEPDLVISPDSPADEIIARVQDLF